MPYEVESPLADALGFAANYLYGQQQAKQQALTYQNQLQTQALDYARTQSELTKNQADITNAQQQHEIDMARYGLTKDSSGNIVPQQLTGQQAAALAATVHKHSSAAGGYTAHNQYEDAKQKLAVAEQQFPEGSPQVTQARDDVKTAWDELNAQNNRAQQVALEHMRTQAQATAAAITAGRQTPAYHQQLSKAERVGTLQGDVAMGAPLPGTKAGAGAMTPAQVNTLNDRLITLNEQQNKDIAAAQKPTANQYGLMKVPPALSGQWQGKWQHAKALIDKSNDPIGFALQSANAIRGQNPALATVIEQEGEIVYTRRQVGGPTGGSNVAPNPPRPPPRQPP